MSFDYEGKLPHWVNRLSFVLRGAVQKRFRAAGHALTAEEWAMLMLLWRDAPQTMASLAEKSLRDRTTVTRLIDGMVDKGLLTRAHSARDRRRIEIDLTEQSQAIQAPVIAIVDDLVAEACAGLDPADIAVAVKVLRAMTENLGGMTADEG